MLANFRLIIVWLCLIQAADSNANGFEDVLKDVLTGYLEKKAEQAGIDVDSARRNSKVTLQFSGADTPAVETFDSLVAQAPAPTPRPTSNETATEKACYQRVQGKIAWNDSGNKSWNAKNVKALCKGATVSSAPPLCFNNAIANGHLWGKKAHHKMGWVLATQLCAKATSPMAPLACVKQKLGQRFSLKNAVNACDANPRTRAGRVRPIPVNSTTANKTGNTAAERSCYGKVQNRIAWNSAGNKKWIPANVLKLCKGAVVAAAPPACFDNAMRRGHLWGKKSGMTMTWANATQLCARAKSATAPLNCVKGQISRNRSLASAINACDARTSSQSSRTRPIPRPATSLKEKECYDYVQGGIAWDAAKRNKNWAKTNVTRLCKGTTSKYSPGNCFSYAMHKGSQWGKRANHRMTWSKAIDLCEGTNNAQLTTACFKKKIQQGLSVDQSVARCDR